LSASLISMRRPCDLPSRPTWRRSIVTACRVAVSSRVLSSRRRQCSISNARSYCRKPQAAHSCPWLKTKIGFPLRNGLASKIRLVHV
jgi:hypothetical protein